MDEENDAIGFDVQSMHYSASHHAVLRKPPSWQSNIPSPVEDKLSASSAKYDIPTGSGCNSLALFPLPFEALAHSSMPARVYLTRPKNLPALCN
jgi:hypothetical protein